MKHPETLPGGRNAKHSVNNNNSNNQISKRSNIMKATTFFRTGLVAIISILFLFSTVFAGDMKNTGTLKNKNGKTTTVSSGNLINTGTVQNAGLINVTGGAGLGNFINSSIVNNYIAGSTGGTIQVNDSYRQTAGTTANQGVSGTLLGTIQVVDSLYTTGTVTTDSGRVIFTGTDGTEKVPVLTYGALAILGSGVHTLAGNITVNDSLRINSTLTVGAANTLTNYATNATPTDGSYTLDGTGGTVIYGKNAAQSVYSSTSYNNLTINGSAGNHNKTVLAPGAVTVLGTLLVGAKDSLDVTGAFSINAGSTVLTDSGEIKLGGSATLNPATNNKAGSIVYYAAAATQTIVGFNYDNLIIRNVTGGSNAKSILTGQTVGVKHSIVLENVTSVANVSIDPTATVDYMGTFAGGFGAQTVAALNYGILKLEGDIDKNITGTIQAVSVSIVNTVSGTNVVNGVYVGVGASLTTTGAAGFVNDGLVTNDGTITVN